ncbi:MAG: hypothetical protein ABIR47_11155 [Candidatus Kapaibacterium sp.]
MKNRQADTPPPEDAPHDRRAQLLAELRAAIRLLAPLIPPPLLDALDNALEALEEYHRDGDDNARHLDAPLYRLAARRKVYELMAGSGPEGTDADLRDILGGWIGAITGEIGDDDAVVRPTHRSLP